MDSRSHAFRVGPIVTVIDVTGQARVSAHMPPWPTAGAAGAWARENHVRAVWLLDFTPPAAGWWATYAPAIIHASAPAGAGVPTVGRWRAHFLSADREAVMIYAPALDSRWGALNEAPGLAAKWRALTLFERAMGQPTAYSPGQMALRLLTPARLKHPDWFDYPHETPIPARVHHGAAYHAEPTALDSGEWLHTWDVNAAHLATAATTAQGTGRLCHAPGAAALTALQAKRPGVYRVELTGGRLPWLPRPGWYDLALARWGAARGGVAITDAYVWTEQHAALRAWAERLWTARERTPAGAARGLVKAGYTAALGRMDYRPRDGTPNPDYRPLWYRAIVSETARRMWARWENFGAIPGVSPCFVWSDTIGTVTGSEVQQIATAGAGLGALRHTGTWHLPDHPDLVALLRAGQTVKALRYLGQTEAA